MSDPKAKKGPGVRMSPGVKAGDADGKPGTAGRFQKTAKQVAAAQKFTRRASMVGGKMGKCPIGQASAAAKKNMVDPRHCDVGMARLIDMVARLKNRRLEVQRQEEEDEKELAWVNEEIARFESGRARVEAALPAKVTTKGEYRSSIKQGKEANVLLAANVEELVLKVNKQVHRLRMHEHHNSHKAAKLHNRHGIIPPLTAYKREVTAPRRPHTASGALGGCRYSEFGSAEPKAAPLHQAPGGVRMAFGASRDRWAHDPQLR